MSGSTGVTGAASGDPARDSGDPARSTGPGPEAPGTYRERLWPAPWVWGAVALLAGLTGVVALPLGPVAGTAALLTAFAAFAALMVSWSPTVTVADDVLVAARARIPLDLLGEVTPLDAVAMRQALGPGLDMRAYLCVRGWIPAGVRADVVDPDDPTPYWLVSSRRPRHLADAVQRARRAARPTAS